MDGGFLLVCVTITSLGAGLLGVRTGFLAPGRLRVATRHTLEILGLGLAFFALNAALLAGGAIAMRSLSGPFVSVYVVNDLALVALSLLQGVLFGQWQQHSATGEKPKPRESPTAAS